jgi:hypothetical protein
MRAIGAAYVTLRVTKLLASDSMVENCSINSGAD